MNSSLQKLLLLVAVFAYGSLAYAQLPNEKFGKPSNLEWDFKGWGDAINADAIILCKTMKVTYQLSDQAFTNTQGSDINYDNLADFGKNNIDDSNILINYEFSLRTKILKPEGAKHANIDITYFSKENQRVADELSDLTIKVFTKNEKGKVEKKNIKTNAFTKERVDANYVVMHVEVPDVEAGSIIEYQYKITSPRPHYIYDWVFQEAIPTVHTKCDIDIPAFLKFNMNVPIHKLIKSGVEAGRLAYDMNRPDLKRGKTCITNHYKIVGDYIRPEDEEIANFTSQINMPNVDLPVFMPKGSTHLKIK